MSEFINENPDVIEIDDLPSRKEDVSRDILLGSVGNEMTLQRKKLLLSIDDSKSKVLQNLELLDKLLLINPPELTSDEESIEESDDEELNAEGPTDVVDAQEIYDLTAHISDPEHPLS